MRRLHYQPARCDRCEAVGPVWIDDLRVIEVDQADGPPVLSEPAPLGLRLCDDCEGEVQDTLWRR